MYKRQVRKVLDQYTANRIAGILMLYLAKDKMCIRDSTKRNLELTETLRNRERQYRLLWLLDKNKTAMGSR